MIADMHRARHLAWELPKQGWEVEILSPDISYQHLSCVDFDSETFFSPLTKINWVPPLWPRLFHRLGVGTIGWRAIISMLITGTRILKRGRFDIIYFSTTQFSLFLAGPIWRYWYGIPYALDFHDPVLTADRLPPVWMSTTTVRYSIGRWVVKHVEKISMRSASVVVSVSPIYLEDFKRRYSEICPSWLEHRCFAAIPFSVLSHDWESISLPRLKPRTPPAKARIIYVGAGGPIMQRSFSLFCEALSVLQRQQPALVDSMQVELYGTHFGWSEGDPRYLAEIAKETGLAELVSEAPARVSYRRSLELLLDSDGALILGVDDAGYMPSKLYPYAYSGKPLLGVARQDGPFFTAFQTIPNLGHSLWFDDRGPMPLAEAVAVLRTFLEEVIAKRIFDRRRELEPFTASAMARRHTELFEHTLAFRGARVTDPMADPAPATGK
jgi:hypothetical protein